MHFFLLHRRAKEVWPDLQGPDPEQVRQRCDFTKQKESKEFLATLKTLLSLHSRGCTDIVCCILFILAILAYIAVGILGKKTALQFGSALKIQTKIYLWKSNFMYPLPFFCVLEAWSQGDPRKVIYPTDSRGQFCGQAGTPLEWVTVHVYMWLLLCWTCSYFENAHK